MMPYPNLDFLRRIQIHGGMEFVVLRPCLAIQLYSYAELPRVKTAAAAVLEAYLQFAPRDALQAVFQVGDNEYSSGFVPFDDTARISLMRELRNGVVEPDAEVFEFVLSATPDGQAGQYGVRLRGTAFAEPEAYPHDSSLLRLELPWDLHVAIGAEDVVALVARLAALFPYFTAHAGLSFTNTIAYEAQARQEIARLVPRFLGFDCAYDWMRLAMRDKVPPTHWIHLLDRDTVDRLGGRSALGAVLAGAELRDLPDGGLLVRAARVPPVGDVNRRALDIGLLPIVADALAPLQYDDPAELGLDDGSLGQDYLDRFIGRAVTPWDNA